MMVGGCSFANAGALECVAVGWVFQYDRARRAVGSLAVWLWAAAYGLGCVGSVFIVLTLGDLDDGVRRCV